MVHVNHCFVLKFKFIPNPKNPEQKRQGSAAVPAQFYSRIFAEIYSYPFEYSSSKEALKPIQVKIATALFREREREGECFAWAPQER